MLFKQTYQALQDKKVLSREDANRLIEDGEYLENLVRDFQTLQLMAY